MTIYLASLSPRRQELCAQIGLETTQLVGAGIDEAARPREAPRFYAARMAREKSLAAQAALGLRAVVEDVIITADTVVAVGRRVLDKTDDAQAAERYLRLLSGRRHRVYGGLVVAVLGVDGWQMRERLSETRVKFARLQERDIAEYLATNQWRGCAGGYAIQGTAGKFVAQLQGSYCNVVGLDLYRLSRLLPEG